MILSTQYYRPPFPNQQRWAEDLALIARTGFDSIYLTASWAWIEAKPGIYDFADYDRLIELAGQNGLKVIVNLWSETQPLWIHRLHADAAMIDHMGREVRSSQLAYMQFGLTPGCCTDHPQIRAKAAAFLSAVASRYASQPQIRLWDCWNEMRWMSQADGYVCFCAHTLQRYRQWLEQRYGSLEALNAAWQRRYVDWVDVMPAKLPARTYTDAMLWQQFITDRTAQELRWRYECVRAQDSRRQIIAHAAFPSIHNTGEYFEFETALGRGNDWQLAKQVDGYGCSHFPSWFHPSPADYGARLEAVRCATGDKPYWLAELQGGAAGHGVQAMEAVPADKQARWIWNGIARGAKAVNFWCWRDEVFSRESGGFGIIGDDGHSEQRLASLARTARLFRKHEQLLDSYRPAPARAGVIFEPLAYQLDWASYTTTGLAPSKETPYPAGHSLQGYLRAFERLQTPYDVVESGCFESLAQYQLLVLPWPMVVGKALATHLVEWVRAGGTLLTEASLDAFDDAGLFKYPAERPLPSELGFKFGARKPLDGVPMKFEINGRKGELRPARWREEVLTAGDDKGQSIRSIDVGEGRVVAIGSFIAVAYWEQRYEDFERFVMALVDLSKSASTVRCSAGDGEVVQWRFGYSSRVPMLFVINDGPGIDVEFVVTDAGLAASRRAIDIASDAAIPLESRAAEVRFRLHLPQGGYRVLRFERP
jgi:beta-galactosidase